MEKIISKNPFDGSTIAEFDTTTLSEIPHVFERARAAQKIWNTLTVRQRAAMVAQICETLVNRADELSVSISNETGRPPFEILSNELLPAANIATYYAKRAPRLLGDRNIPLVQFKHRQSVLNCWPLGVVAIFSPKKGPFYLPFAEIIMALLAGNAIVFKPGADASASGLKIQELCDEAGLPPNVLQTVLGRAEVGDEIVNNAPDKIFFTGTAEAGKKILAMAAARIIPATVEYGGGGTMIVLSDANIDRATSAALWAIYSGTGYDGLLVRKLVIHESVAGIFKARLEEKLKTLSSAPEMSSLSPAAAGRGAALPPIIIFKSLAEAVKRTNESSDGLLACIFTRNYSMGEQLAHQLEVGSVTINDVFYPGALPEVPWGAVRGGGYGKRHGQDGLFEFVNIRHIHRPKSRALEFKSPWWFPYTPYQAGMFRKFMDLYHKHFTDRILAFPLFLWNLVHYIKKERRL